MSEDQFSHLQSLLDRLNQGDPSACRELIEATYPRLRALAQRMLHVSFPPLENLHETDSVLNQTMLRVQEDLSKARPPTVRDYFQWVSWKMRCILTDWVRRWRRERDLRVDLPNGPSDDSSQGRARSKPSDSTFDPAKLAGWTEIHEGVDKLPEPERAVFNLYFYQALTFEQTAQLLKIAATEARRRWYRACEHLRRRVKGLDDLL